MRKLEVKEVVPGSLLGMASVPLGFLRGPRFKTGLASILSRKYPKEFKTEVFKKPLFTGESRSGLLTGGQQKLLPSPQSAGYKYNPPGYSVPPVKPLITPFEKSGPPIQAGRPEMSYTESKRWYKEYQTQKLGEALKKQLLAQKSTSPKTLLPSKGTDPLIAEARKYKTAEEFVENKFKKDLSDFNKTLSEKYPNVDFYVSQKGDEIKLSKVIVPVSNQRKGTGTQFMNDLLAYADSKGKRIILTADASYGGNKARLIEFYKRFGFRENKGKSRDFSISETMVREGKPLKQDYKSNLTSLWQQAHGNIEKGSLESRIIKREIKKK